MYSKLPSFILGFHGCDESIVRNIISGDSTLLPSNNSYDWLGTGIYFWENSPGRALKYARECMKRSTGTGRRIKKPAVIGAIIDLGHCLNLLDHKFIEVVRSGHRSFMDALDAAQVKPPKNKAPRGSKELLLRHLDCAVINWIHEERVEKASQSHDAATDFAPFDSVRAAFIEGKPIYKNSGFSERNHIQICIRNNACIKGYFLPRTYS